MYEYNCKIVRVIDGDSIILDIDLGFGLWIHGESIRLYGVDCPECRSRDKLKKKQPDSWRRSLSKKRCMSEKHTPSLPKKRKVWAIPRNDLPDR
jgi:hypothetical protein